MGVVGIGQEFLVANLASGGGSLPGCVSVCSASGNCASLAGEGVMEAFGTVVLA